MSVSVTELSDEDLGRIDKAFGVKRGLVEFNPGGCLMPPYFEQIAQQIIDAPVREDDIWLVGYPRTGSTWCQEMVWLLANDLDYETAKNTIQQIRAPLIETSTTLIMYQKTLGALVENSVEYVNNMPSPRFIKSHLPLPLLPSQLQKINPKIIYTCRNPKDMAVSSFLHYKLVHNLSASFEEFCDLLLNNLMPLGNVWPHYLTMWHKRNEPNILFLTYENMNRDVKGTLKKIAAFLDKSYTEDEYDELCEYLSFNQMRSNKAVNLEDMLEEKNGKDYYKRVGDHFIRKGQVGDWKNYMSPELAKKFDAWTAENTKGTGLSFD